MIVSFTPKRGRVEVLFHSQEGGGGSLFLRLLKMAVIALKMRVTILE